MSNPPKPPNVPPFNKRLCAEGEGSRKRDINTPDADDYQGDGLRVLSAVLKTYRPMKELWSVCKELNASSASMPRGICIDHRVPEDLAVRLLQNVYPGGGGVGGSGSGGGGGGGGVPRFPVTRVSLGVPSHVPLYKDEERTKAANDPLVARSLTILAQLRSRTLESTGTVTAPAETQEQHQPRQQQQQQQQQQPGRLLQELRFSDNYAGPIALDMPLLDEVNEGEEAVLTVPAVKVIRFGRNFNYAVRILGGGCEEVHFCGQFNQQVTLPDSVERVFFDRITIGKMPSIVEAVFNRPLHLPPKLKELVMGHDFNQPFTAIPASLKVLRVGYKYRQPLPALPEGLEELRFDGGWFDHPIEELPSSLKILQLSSLYNEPLTLPPALKEVTFGRFFNQPLFDLPVSIEFLKFGQRFDQMFNVPAGSHLKTLVFGDRFDQSINLSEATVLEHLTFGIYFNKPVELPAGLKSLTFSEAEESGAQTGEDGEVFFEPESAFNQPITLPQGIESVEFNDSFNQPFDIPASLRHLTLVGFRFNQAIEIPPGSKLKTLVFYGLFNQPLLSLPLAAELEVLTFGSNFNQPLMIKEDSEEQHGVGNGGDGGGGEGRMISLLPLSLKRLGLGCSFNQVVDLHVGLTRVRFGRAFHQPVRLPKGLEVAESYSISCPDVILPDDTYEWIRALGSGYPHRYRKKGSSTSFDG